MPLHDGPVETPPEPLDSKGARAPGSAPAHPSTVSHIGKRKRPRLYRLSHALSLAGVIAILLVILFVGTAMYSLYTTVRSPAFVSKVGVSGSNQEFNLAEPGESLGFYLDISNAGWYPFRGMSVGVNVSLPSGKTLVLGMSNPQDIPSGGSANLSLTVPIDLAKIGNTTLRSLLTGDTNLSERISLHGTYAYVFPFSIIVSNTAEWLAPFYNLQVAIGTPTATSVPTTIQFTNQGSLSEVGTLTLYLNSANGQPCGSNSLSLNVPGGTHYDQTLNVSPIPGCDLNGGTESSTFTFSSGLSYSLGSQVLP